MLFKVLIQYVCDQIFINLNQVIIYWAYKFILNVNKHDVHRIFRKQNFNNVYACTVIPPIMHVSDRIQSE